MNRYTVLVAEDEETDWLLLQIAVKRSGRPIDLRRAKNGREAIRYLAGESPYDDRNLHPVPDLLLLDLHMPIMTGFDVLRWMRSRMPVIAIDTVVFTSSTHDVDREHSIAIGAIAFRSKPCRPLAYVEFVEELYTSWLTKAG
jgi:CheY-like chemotaxis protein